MWGILFRFYRSSRPRESRRLAKGDLTPKGWAKIKTQGLPVTSRPVNCSTSTLPLCSIFETNKINSRVERSLRHHELSPSSVVENCLTRHLFPLHFYKPFSLYSANLHSFLWVVILSLFLALLVCDIHLRTYQYRLSPFPTPSPVHSLLNTPATDTHFKKPYSKYFQPLFTRCSFKPFHNHWLLLIGSIQLDPS